MSVIRFQIDPDLSDEEIFERLLVLRGKVEKHGDGSHNEKDHGNRYGVSQVQDLGNMVDDLVPADSVFDLSEVLVSEYAIFEIEDYIEDPEQQPYLDALVAAYRSGGRDVPPIVLDDADGVLDGGHRLAAAKRAGLERIPAFIMRGADVEKHGGPGPHKGTGTDQSVHGKGGSISGQGGGEAGSMPDSARELLAMNDKMETKSTVVYPTEIKEAAADLLQVAIYREAELSAIVKAAAGDAEFKGWDHRIKYTPSIASKITRNMAELEAAGLDPDLDKAVEMVTDLNRYTILSDNESFIRNFSSVVDDLDRAGWQSWDHKIKNYFAVRNDSFDGIVSKFRNSSGAILEIQFHTKLSAKIAETSHDLFNVARELPVGDPRRQELAREMVALWNTSTDHIPEGVFEVGTPSEQLFKHGDGSHDDKDHGNRYRRYDTLEEMEQAGFITDEWGKWQQGYCGTYACALIEEDPSLRLGGLDFENSDDDEFFAPTHYFAHDDKYAYDSAGKHPLPYKGVSGDALQSITDLGDPEDWGLLEDEGATPEDIEAAKAHARRHGVRS